MSTFVSFNDRLPDPTFSVTDANSASVTGTKGPGFASVTVSSNRPAQVSRTNSGRGVHRESGQHTWDISITYHPMLRDQFDTIDTFLEGRDGRLNPFFVVLPQNSKPKDPAFYAYALFNSTTVPTATSAGSPTILMQAGSALTSYPKPGDFFNISDPNDINHLKAYKVTAVETNSNYQSGTVQPAVNQVRLHISPPLTKFVEVSSNINWINPRFRVIQKADVIEYQLSTDNLYQFQLSLEEIMP